MGNIFDFVSGKTIFENLWWVKTRHNAQNHIRQMFGKNPMGRWRLSIYKGKTNFVQSHYFLITQKSTQRDRRDLDSNTFTLLTAWFSKHKFQNATQIFLNSNFLRVPKCLSTLTNVKIIMRQYKPIFLEYAFLGIRIL